MKNQPHPLRNPFQNKLGKTSKLLILTMMISFYGESIISQQEIALDLKKVIQLAQSDAPEALLAETRLSNSSWRYQSFIADYKPRLDLFATLPDLNRSIESITLPDGTDKFLNRSLLRGSATLTLRQDIPQTGGSIFAYSGLQRLDVLKTDNNEGVTSYFATPISIRLEQPIAQFNPMKWDRIIEPIELEESKKDYTTEMEGVAYQAIQYYFQVLNAQLSLEAAEREKSNSDTLFTIGGGRFKVGKIAETELLQLQLRVMNADAALSSAKLNLTTSTEQLRNFLGIKEATNFNLSTPSDVPDFLIDTDLALERARLYRSEIVSFKRRLLEAQRDVEEATKSRGVNINLNGRFGLSQTDNNLADVYGNPLDQEQLTLGLSIPIADFGKSRARKEIALSNEKLIRMTVAQEKVNLEREIITKIQQLSLKRDNITLSLRALEAAQKRFGLTQNRYVIGKVDATELNLANNDREQNRQSYVNALQDFWVAYFELRLLTLYDWVEDKPLIKEK